MKISNKTIAFAILIVFLLSIASISCVLGDDKVEGETIDNKLKGTPSSTDSETVEREEEQISAERLSVKQMKLLREQAANFEYQAEVSELMNIIINSLYSNVNVFLRELISNASDAIDKIRIQSLTDASALKGKEKLEIKIKVDKENKLLHIIDSGIGMTKDELINNLGTIAKSGTREFIKQLTQEATADASNLIGKFGVGFYSAFLVADKVTVISKHNESDKQYVWESESGKGYFVAEDPRGNTLVRGTQITLHLNKDHLDLLNTDELEGLLKKYSEFIEYPIYLWKSHEETEQVELT